MEAIQEEDDGPSPSTSSVIINGTVAGRLPPTASFAVNYPGYPSSTSRAIHTLGGLSQISKASSVSGSLELRFRPEDPFSHPAFGQPRAFTGLLLKLSKTRPEPDSPVAEPKRERLSAEVVARVNQAFDFEGMVDYQHVVPVHAAAAAERKQRRIDGDGVADGGADDVLTERKQRSIDGDSEVDGGADDVLMLVPQLFAPKDKPENLVLHRPVNLFSKNIQRGVVEHRWEMDIEPCLAIPFNIERIPVKVDWENNIPRDTAEWEMQLVVSKLFEERPIWPRWSLYERLIDDGHEVTENQLKRLLFRTGYYFSHGPYGKFWIIKGYDPRKDPESRIYQKVDFRVPPKLRYLTDVNTNKGSKQTWKDVCRFQVMPMKNFVLQFFELVDDSIQQEIRKPTDQTKCTFPTGWFSIPRLKTLGLLVKVKFLSLFPKGSADDLLRTAFERIKRFKEQEMLHISERTKKSMEQEVVHTCSQLGKEHQIMNQESYALEDELESQGDKCEIEYDDDDEEEEMDFDVYASSPGKEHQIMNRESNAPEDEREGQGDKCEIENDEDDDEEEEMDFDGYASSPVPGEDDNLSPRACSYQIEESIPNDYLQEILRGFPFGSDGRDPKRTGAEDADLSDDAFQIYEQDSDGNYDD